MQDLSELITLARQGDSRAFEGVVRRFQDMAVGYAYALLGNWQEAEEAAQDAFVSAYYGLIKLRDVAAFPGWFRRIVYTQAHRRLRVKEPLLVSLEQVGEIAVVDPPHQLEQAQLLDQVAALINSLPAPQQTVLLLYYMNDRANRVGRQPCAIKHIAGITKVFAAFCIISAGRLICSGRASWVIWRPLIA